MNIKTLFTSATLISAAVFLGGCATSPENVFAESTRFESGSCRFADGKEQAPDWLCLPKSLFPAEWVYEKGMGDARINDLNLRYTEAVENAKAKIARDTSGNVTGNFRRYAEMQQRDGAYREKVETEVLTEIRTDVTLPPAQKEFEVYDSQGNLYVLVRMSKSELNALVDQKERQLQQLFNSKIEQLENATNPPTQQKKPELKSALERLNESF